MMKIYKLIKFNDDGSRTENIVLLPDKRGPVGQAVEAKVIRNVDKPVLIEGVK